jgi:beta-glucosidase
LPLPAGANVLVAGDGANDIGKQSGGWTLSWQGTGNSNEYFPNATSIYAGIKETVEAAGGTAALSVKGDWNEKPDVAIVVFGENPYAEGVGDRVNVDYDSDDGLELLKKLKEAGIPTVSVFISGRALWVNPELNHSDAFVAAWLPGSEGGGVADVLFADASGQPRHDFAGRLSYSWPANAAQVDVNVGDPDYRPLFPYGYGLAYGDSSSLPVLSEDPALADNVFNNTVRMIEFGKPVSNWRIRLKDKGGDILISDERGTSPEGLLQIEPADYKRQEDTFIATWDGPASLIIEGDPASIQQLANQNGVLELSYQVMESNGGKASLAIGQGALDLTGALESRAGAGWQTSRILLSCFVETGAGENSLGEPMVITAEGAMKLQLTSAYLVADSDGADCNL